MFYLRFIARQQQSLLESSGEPEVRNSSDFVGNRT